MAWAVNSGSCQKPPEQCEFNVDMCPGCCSAAFSLFGKARSTIQEPQQANYKYN